MRIDPFTQIDSRPASAAPVRWPWQVGAVLEVIAIRDISSGQLWLQLANQQRLPARLLSVNGREPADGETLQLRVMDDGAQLVLASMDEPVTDTVLDMALRRAAPQQLPPTALLATVQGLVNDAQRLRELPEGVRHAVMQLWQTLPAAQQLLSANSLTDALRNSGWLLEHKLVDEAVPPTLHNDVKAALLQLRAQLQQSLSEQGPKQRPESLPARELNPYTTSKHLAGAAMPDLRAPITGLKMPLSSLPGEDSSDAVLSTLKAQVAGYLARIETNQVLTAQSQQQGIPAWLIEVPVRWDDHAELLRFKFEREGKQGEKATAAAAAWRVEVALDMGAQGMLHAELSLHSEHGLQIKLRSDSAKLVSDMTRQLPLLVNALSSDGLTLDSIRCLHGLPLRSSAQPGSTLLDIRA